MVLLFQIKDMFQNTSDAARDGLRSPPRALTPPPPPPPPNLAATDPRPRPMDLTIPPPPIERAPSNPLGAAMNRSRFALQSLKTLRHGSIVAL